MRQLEPGNIVKSLEDQNTGGPHTALENLSPPVPGVLYLTGLGPKVKKRRRTSAVFVVRGRLRIGRCIREKNLPTRGRNLNSEYHSVAELPLFSCIGAFAVPRPHPVGTAPCECHSALPNTQIFRSELKASRQLDP
jgi:hypothetical protein